MNDEPDFEECPICGNPQGDDDPHWDEDLEAWVHSYCCPLCNYN